MNLKIWESLYEMNNGYFIDVEIGIIRIGLILFVEQSGAAGPDIEYTCRYPVYMTFELLLPPS